MVGRGVPGDRGVAEVGFIGHVTGQRGVVAEDSVLSERLARFDGTEERPKVRADVVKIVALVDVGFGERFLADLCVVLGVPLLEVGVAERLRVAARVVAGSRIFAGLRIVSEAELGDFENSLGALEAVNLWIFATEIEAKINRSATGGVRAASSLFNTPSPSRSSVLNTCSTNSSQTA